MAAADGFAHAADLDPTASRFNDLGAALAQAGRPDAAIQAFRRVVALEPGHARGWSNLAACLIDVDDLAGAAKALAEAGRIDPTGHAPRRNRARFLEACGLHAAAADAFAELRAERPDDPDLAIDLLRTRLAAGDHLGAEAVATEVTLARPDWAFGHHLAAAVATAAGRTTEAAERYRRSLALDPEDQAGSALALAALDPSASPDRASAAFVRGLFDQYAPRFDRALTEGLDYDAPAILRALVDRVAPLTAPVAEAIDLGCGTGLAARAFRPLARRWTGIDLSPAMLDRAAERGVYDRLIVADLVPALDERPPASVGLAVAADVLMYLGDLDPLFQALARAMVPGGLVAATTEAGPDAPPGWRVGDGRRFAHGPGYLGSALERAGLKALALEAVSTRKDRGQPVPGYAFLALRA
jgi:predicted TPR repeat methyltransferase